LTDETNSQSSDVGSDFTGFSAAYELARQGIRAGGKIGVKVAQGLLENKNNRSFEGISI